MVMAKIGTVDPITRKRSMTDSTAIAWAGSIDGMGGGRLWGHWWDFVEFLASSCGLNGNFYEFGGFLCGFSGTYTTNCIPYAISMGLHPPIICQAQPANKGILMRDLLGVHWYLHQNDNILPASIIANYEIEGGAPFLYKENWSESMWSDPFQQNRSEPVSNWIIHWETQ